jgi:hypothetical protein
MAWKRRRKSCPRNRMASPVQPNPLAVSLLARNLAFRTVRHLLPRFRGFPNGCSRQAPG